jgi:hypothetical protein
MCKCVRHQCLDIKAETLRLAKDSDSATIYGEYLGPGVQKNIYGLSHNEIKCFDIKIDGEFMDASELARIWVPILAKEVTLKEWLQGISIQEASNGVSLLANTKREGIVVKPMIEQRHPTLGRLILKQRSPEYLAKSDF